MRLVVTENITLDGVIEGNDWFNPSDTESVDPAHLAEVRKAMAEDEALLLGRKTFESFRGFWPKQTKDSTGIADHLNKVAKYVVSKTMKDPDWENSRVLTGKLVDDVTSLKAAPGKNLGVTGSISVVRELIDAELVDEFRLYLYPVVRGHGRKLFPNGTARADLDLVEAVPFHSGIVLLKYEPSGEM